MPGIAISVMGRFGVAVLTGGAASRMGRDKATVEVWGAPMVEWIRRAAEAAGASWFATVGGPRGDLVESTPGHGPLPAVLCAIDAAVDAALDAVVVVACDMPAVAPATLQALVSALWADPDAVAATAVADGHRQPLLTAWRTGAAETIRAVVTAEGAGPRVVLERLAAGVVTVEVDAAEATSVDTPAALAAMEALAPRWVEGLQ